MLKLNKQYLGRFSSAAALGALWLVIGAALRLVLIIKSHGQVLTGPWELLKVFAVGGFFDLTVIPQALLPVLIYVAVVPRRFFDSKVNKVIITALIWLSTALIMLGAVVEFYFWDEFQSRFNFIAVDYLVYTQEVWGMIRDSYPLGPILAVIGVLAAVLTVYIWKKWLCWETSLSVKRRLGALAAILLFPVVMFFAVSENMKNISTNIMNNELAGNGLYELVSAFRNNELDYGRFYRTRGEADTEQMLRRLLKEPRSEYKSEQPWDMTRHIQGSGQEKHPNIVFITVESLDAEFMTAFGNSKGLTPNLDRLAQESLFFTQVYATGTRTVRGLEAVSLAIPPTPGQSILRRPDNADLFTLGSVLKGKDYTNWFVYGGYGYFDNMNEFYARNGYNILDRTAIPKEKIMLETVWGVADEVIFSEATELLDKAYAQGGKTFELIMTTSNHRPYMYPDGRIDIPSPGGRDGAVKYTDWAIGNFLAEAKTHPWFKDTIFVITADHQASSSGKTEIPVKKYHIPLLVYAPDLIAPGRVDRLMSQIDIAPTLLGILNFSYDSRFMGYDLLHLPEGQERIFVGTYQNLGYAKGDRLVVLKPKGQASLYKIDNQTGEYTPLPEDPELINEAITWYQGASYLYKTGGYRSVN
jgi:phosphoglycerol transferase MdoB-like AlkP superfamily enzyme